VENTREKKWVSLSACNLLVIFEIITVCFISSEYLKPLLVDFPSNNWYQSPVRQKTEKFFGIYPNFQSCQKHILIIPQCRVHPYELTGAKISFIGARGSLHAPPEESAPVAHAQRRAQR
jgi:hypothetical protein